MTGVLVRAKTQIPMKKQWHASFAYTAFAWLFLNTQCGICRISEYVFISSRLWQGIYYPLSWSEPVFTVLLLYYRKRLWEFFWPEYKEQALRSTSRLDLCFPPGMCEFLHQLWQINVSKPHFIFFFDFCLVRASKCVRIIPLWQKSILSQKQYLKTEINQR